MRSDRYSDIDLARDNRDKRWSTEEPAHEAQSIKAPGAMPNHDRVIGFVFAVKRSQRPAAAVVVVVVVVVDVGASISVATEQQPRRGGWREL